MNNRKLHIDTYWNGFATDFQSDGKAVFLYKMDYLSLSLQLIHLEPPQKNRKQYKNSLQSLQKPYLSGRKIETKNTHWL